MRGSLELGVAGSHNNSLFLNVIITTTIILKCYYLILWRLWQHGVVIITFKYNGSCNI